MKPHLPILFMFLFAICAGLATGSFFGTLAAFALAGFLCCMMSDLCDLIGKIK